MEFPPDNYFIFPTEQLENAVPRINGDFTIKILAQARPNGRVMDHWPVVLGGAKALEAESYLAAVIPAAVTLPKWRPRDVIIRRNMTTSGWLDLLVLLTANEVAVVSETGENVVNATMIEALSNLPHKTVNSASCRWAVCVGEAGKLELQLQSLPCSANLLAGKPIYKRYINRILYCPGNYSH